MKKLFAILTALLAVAALLCSCTKTGKIIPEREREGLPPIEEVEPVSLSLTFVLPEDGLKAAWVDGDQIVVHGEYAKDQVTVTLAAADIADGGKTATKTVEGLRPYVREDCTSTLSASWPAEAVSNIDHCFFYSGFTNTNTLLMAACNDDQNKFAFRELTAPIDFQVDGGYDAYAFTGRKDAYVGYEYLQVKITDKEFVVNQFHKTPVVTVSGKLAAGAESVQRLFLPVGTELPAGFDLKLFKDGTAEKVYTDKTKTTAEQGKTLELGSITDKLKDYVQAFDVTTAVSLIENEVTANCYIVTAPGIYKFPSVQGNTNVSVGAVETVEVLWETWNNKEEVVAKSLVKAGQYEGGQIYIEVPAPFHAGNALVAAKDEDENILWSWHIWMPETLPTTSAYGIMNTSELMSRNLGALVDTAPGAPADVRSFGLLYEWGRKDPFLGADGPGSTERVTFAGTKMTLIDAESAPITLEASCAQPTALVNKESAWIDNNDNYLWGDIERGGSPAKALTDPCPAGYRIPTRSYCNLFSVSSNTGLKGFKYDAANAVLTAGDPATYFPICGYMKCDGTFVADEAIVWDSRNDYENGKVSYNMTIAGGNAGKESVYRTYGGSVRCMKD